jgi:spore germination cell wall hydrolase CwlJ-like protein
MNKNIQHVLLLVSLWLLILLGVSGVITHQALSHSQEVISETMEQHQRHLVVSSMRKARHDEMMLRQIGEHYRREVECLARNMYFEARGEGVRGQQAVAFVTINRVRSNRFPNNVCEVVYQARTYSDGSLIPNKCQFSWVCDGTNTSRIDSRVYNIIRRDAEYIYVNYYLNDNMADITNGSTHFHARRVRPHWSQHANYQRVDSIGDHIFYRPTY